MIERVKVRKLKENRIDDQIETLKRRIKSYEDETIPAINKLSEKFSLLSINGNGPILKVHEEIYKGLKYLI